jgi:two-component system, cell cycle sensor histidine kinase and response regulator CckA
MVIDVDAGYGPATAVQGTGADTPCARSETESILHETMARSGPHPTERFRLAMTHAAVGMALVTPDGEYREVNDALCRMYGRTEAELCAMRWADVTHPDDLAESQALVAEILDGTRDAYRQVKRYVRPDGSVMWGDVIVACVRDDAGRMAYLIAQVVDITERIAAEEALRASEERYRTLVSEIDGVVFVNDLANRSIFCSGQVEQLLGYPPEQMVLPGAWRGLVHEDDRERVWRAWDNDGDLDEYRQEYRIHRADGKVIWIEERWHAKRDAEGRVTRWSSVINDVTSRRRLEETLTRTDRLEAVSRVAAAAAQDFGEVLTTIQYAQVNIADAVAPDQPCADDVRLIGDAVRRGIQLTKQLLAFGRDRDEADAAPLEVAWLLADLEQILRGVAGTSELRIDVRADALTRVSRSALEQAVLNLVINARDATPAGGTISVTLDRELVRPDSGLGIPPGAYLALAVSDTGCGMPEAVVRRVFEPFFTTKPHGSGIGLAAVFATMRSIGGTVQVQSTEGEGTTITLLMPEAGADEDAAAE